MRGTSIFSALAAFVALAAVAGPAAAVCNLSLVAETPVTMVNGLPVVPAVINGKHAQLAVNSDSSLGDLTPAATERLGLRLQPLPRGMIIAGPNGIVRARMATAQDVTVLGQHFKDIQFLVTSSLAGEIDGVLGQNMLDVADVEFDLANGVIRLFQPKDCADSNLAYWDQGGPYSVIALEKHPSDVRRFLGAASINGAAIRVAFATGWRDSILTLSAAKRAGVKPGDPGVTASDVVSEGASWTAPFTSFKIGDEEIKDPRLRISAIPLDVDMMLGADFFLSHRVYMANSQHRIYFTYNGGPVFRLDLPAAQPLAQGPAQPPAASGAEAPLDAAAYARRGAASAARHDFAPALADLDRAVALQPAEPGRYYDRAGVRFAAGLNGAAIADLDQALTLKPRDASALTLRGEIRLSDSQKDKPDDKAVAQAAARADLDRAADLDPSRQRDIAAAYEKAQMFEAAVRQFDRWIEAYPNRDEGLATALYNRCWDRAQWGQELDQALADCNAALKRFPIQPVILGVRGLVRFRMGQLDKADADYSAALGWNPDFAWARYCRGVTRLRQGRTAQGQADIAAAVKVMPGLPDETKAYGVTP